MKKLLIMAAFLAVQSLAQKPLGYYHLDFVVKELDEGKALSARTYSTSIDPTGTCAIRTGDKLPIQSGGNTTYIDVGVNIDCNSAVLREDNMAMHVSADISSMGSERMLRVEGRLSGVVAPPIIHQVKWSAVVLVPIGKPTTIFSSDGATGKRQTRLELTVTPIP